MVLGPFQGYLTHTDCLKVLVWSHGFAKSWAVGHSGKCMVVQSCPPNGCQEVKREEWVEVQYFLGHPPADPTSFHSLYLLEGSPFTIIRQAGNKTFNKKPFCDTSLNYKKDWFQKSSGWQNPCMHQFVVRNAVVFVYKLCTSSQMLRLSAIASTVQMLCQ